MLSLSSPLLLQILGAFIGGTCLLVVGVQNPIHSLLLLIIVFLRGTLLLFTLQIEYFAILFLIVYVGAIVVLFLFVIRILEIKRVNVARRFRDIVSYRHLAVALLALEVLLLASQDAFDLSPFLVGFSELPPLTERNGYVDWSKLLHRTDPLRALGGLLYTEYGTTLLIAALLLTIAIVGSIGVTLVPVAAISPTSDSESPISVPINLNSPRTIKRQEGEHQAIRHPTLLSTSVRTPIRQNLILFVLAYFQQFFLHKPSSSILYIMSIYSVSVRNPLLAAISNHLDGYPSPVNLSYLWGFGSLSGIALGVQIVTGVCLARHYAPEIHLAFASVEHIRRDVRGGVALRYVHANGASRFFIVVYTHRFRGLYYGSYRQPRAALWYSGVVLFVLRRATAFRGYVLPWGQRSFWGATVITNLFSALPGVGTSIVQLLWGGFSVDNPTLNRFFSLHYLLPFLIAGRAFLHLILLHQHGSNNPLGVVSTYDRIPFYPYFYVKDLFGFFIFVLLFSFFVVYAPNYRGHPDNYIEANPLVTPAHIVPEWYFLPFYAILRTIPDKLGGVALRGLAIVILTLLPIVDTSSFRSTFFKPLHLGLFWFFLWDSVSLGWIGQEIVESPFIERANFVTLVYFAFFVPLLPLFGFLETARVQRSLSLSRLLFSVFPQQLTVWQSINLIYVFNVCPIPPFPPFNSV